MPPTLPTTTLRLAERHEALWLRLSALHKDITAIAAKKPDAPVGATERVAAESLMADCVPFMLARTRPKARLPVAAAHFAGLAVQLGQAMAELEAFENRHAGWDARQNCRCWRVPGDPIPVARLRQTVEIKPATTYSGENMRDKLWERIQAQRRQAFEHGFYAGRKARSGPPEGLTNDAGAALAEKTYPRPKVRKL